MRINLFLAAALFAAMAITGCKKDHFGPSGGRNNGSGGGSNTPEEVKIEENPDWTVTYLGRNDYKEADGSVSRVEEFRFKYTGANYFIVRSLQEGVLQDSYDGSLKEFFTTEAKAIVDAAGDGNWYDNNGVFDKTQTGIVAFDLLFHGNYTTYLIELNAKGGITGKYAKHTHPVEEEEAVPNFSRWIGEWHVGDNYSAYDISISSAENNYFYFIDGWETGQSVSKQMNKDEDWIYARYDKNDGNLHFYGQFVSAYEDEELGDVDKMFVGTFINGTQGETVDGEGADYQWNIAHTEQDGESFSIQPEVLQFKNDAGQIEFEAPIKTMRYTRWVYKTSTWSHYNTAGVPTLPLTMTRIEVLQGPAKAHKLPVGPAVKGKHTQRGALKVHTPKTSR